MREMIKLACLTLILVSLPIADADAQPTGMTATRVANPADLNAMPLYPGVAPGSEGATQKEVTSKVFGELWIRNVTRPTLTPYLPKKGTANGAAVLVIPGGGFKFVSMSNEGTPIAQWLAARGVAAFVLKYRVDETPDGEADFGKYMQAQFSSAVRGEDGPPPGDDPTLARARVDAQAALRMIRAHARHYGIDPKRVGMLGFSAGAMTTLATTLADAPDARPDFIAPIYGFMTPVAPPANPQPMFVAMASDDSLFNKQGFGLIESWAKAGGSTEFHYYSGGGHGFGSHKKGTTSDLWFDQFMTWMGAQGLLKPAKQP